MLPFYPRISVLMITYNQENYISRALDSLLVQRDYLYEVCINDDCSTDRTFDILEEYRKRFPNIIKPIRNQQNLGIFKNIEATWSRPSGDIVYRLAGDDECGNGYFQRVVEFIEEKGIDYKNELFCIYGDYKEVEPDGSVIVYKNSLVKNHDAMRLGFRKLISNRSACYSKKILDRFEKVSEDRSFNAEIVQEIQLQLFAEKNYYLPVVGNIYYSGIGISTRLNKKEKEERILQGYQRKIDFATQHGYKIENKDLAFLEFMKAYRFGKKMRAIRYYFSSIDPSLGLKGMHLDRILFVLKKGLKGNRYSYSFILP